MKRALPALLVAAMLIGAPLLVSAATGGAVISPSSTGGTVVNSGSTGGTIVPPTNTGTTNNQPGYLSNPLQAQSFSQLFDEIFAALRDIGYLLVILAIVYCGFLFVAAQGNQEKLQEARRALIWTIVGGLVILGASVIESVITSTAQAL